MTAAGGNVVSIPVRPVGMTYERAMSIALSVDARAHGIDVTPDQAADRWPIKPQIIAKGTRKPKPGIVAPGGTPEQIDAIVRLTQEGWNDKELGEYLGVARKTVGVWRTRLGIPPQPITRNHNRELHEALLKAYRDGLTDSQTAERLGMRRQIVAQARIRYGIPCNKAPR